jgi:thioredoxin-like negative regulator of GroEL
MTTLCLPLALLLAGPAGTPPAAQRIRWERNLDEAVKAARVSQRPLMVDFWAEWCGWCRRLDQTTYRDPNVVHLSAAFVAVKVDTEGTQREVEFAGRYNVSSLPTIVFLSPEGRPLLRIDGYQGPGVFPQTLEEAKGLAGRVMDWESVLRKSPADAATLTSLGLYQFEREFFDDAFELLSRAVRVDRNLPAGDRKRARLLIAVMDSHQRRFAASEAQLKDALEIKPADPLDAKLLYNLARTYSATGRVDQARETLKQVIQTTPTGTLADKARETLNALDQTAVAK